MAKKKKRSSKKKTAKKKAAGKKRVSCKDFLSNLYEATPNISNERALEKLLAKYPNSKATTKSIITWKCMLRQEGQDIPMQRAGAKPKTAKKAKKKKAKKAKKKSSRRR